MQILTGDIGGTNTRLAMVDLGPEGIRVLDQARFASASFPSLYDIIREYRAAREDFEPAAAAFGVAGPVHQGISRITNLPWVVSAQELAERLGLGAVFVLNDLEALAWGIDALAPEELVSLQAGGDLPCDNRAVIAAGTGLGQAGLTFDGTRHKPFPTEGGHCDFAPVTEQDWRLLTHLQPEFGHVSWERLVSGPGLERLYAFLLHESKAVAPDWFTDPDADAAAQITTRALVQSDGLCVEALRWFVRLYGAEAGNLALKMKATGGLYLGGGIAPKILPTLQGGGFMEAFLDKGRMRELLERVPVRVICNADVALLGLAHYADLYSGGPVPYA
ncbi:MAG: glucokinase [Thiogranum sp.]|nr:glucokinase [Thiogranum sp.]